MSESAQQRTVRQRRRRNLRRDAAERMPLAALLLPSFAVLPRSMMSSPIASSSRSSPHAHAAVALEAAAAAAAAEWRWPGSSLQLAERCLAGGELMRCCHAPPMLRAALRTDLMKFRKRTGNDRQAATKAERDHFAPIRPT